MTGKIKKPHTVLEIPSPEPEFRTGLRFRSNVLNRASSTFLNSLDELDLQRNGGGFSYQPKGDRRFRKLKHAFKRNKKPEPIINRELDREKKASRLVSDPPETKGSLGLDMFLFMFVMFIIITWTWITVSSFKAPERHCTEDSFM